MLPVKVFSYAKELQQSIDEAKEVRKRERRELARDQVGLTAEDFRNLNGMNIVQMIERAIFPATEVVDADGKSKKAE